MYESQIMNLRLNVVVVEWKFLLFLECFSLDLRALFSTNRIMIFFILLVYISFLNVQKLLEQG